MKFFVRTIGCKMNLLDSARVATALCRAGHEQVHDEVAADVVLVNSCTVTAESDRKSRQAVRGADRHGKRVIVLGCGPRVDPARWYGLVPDLAVIACDDDLVALGMDPPSASLPIAPRTRLPIPIQTGCDNACAYCITRIARGPHRSEPLEVVVDHVRRAEGLGVREVVLTGINLAAWGCDRTTIPAQSRLPELLRALLDRTNIARIRLSSLGPEYLGDAFFEVLADDRICDHLHLSVQSGSPSVLARMRRGHGVQEVLHAVREARRVRAHVALTADFIVGLPGETEDDFQATCALVREARFARLHVFPFSSREGTDASTMPGQVAPDVKKRRSAELRALGRTLRAEFLASQRGRRVSALVDGHGTALTTNYIRLRAARGRRGELVEAVIRVRDVVDRD